MPKGIYKRTEKSKRSEKTRKQIAEKLKGNTNGFQKGHLSIKGSFEKGHKPWNEGLPPEKQTNWKGGISHNPYPDDWKDDIKEAIRKRDNYICQICGIHQDELGYKLDVHHIDYDKDNLNPENLITLCRSCHIKTNFNREYWKHYFI